jgi:hypothetical protein
MQQELLVVSSELIGGWVKYLTKLKIALLENGYGPKQGKVGNSRD